jgi:hypothetical protein
MADTGRTTIIQRWYSRLTGWAPSESSATASACQDTAGGAAVATIPPDGREVFLPPLESGRVYEITVAGTCGYWGMVGIFFQTTKEARADALYHTDYLGNFVEPHDWLKMDGRPFKCSPRMRVAEAVPEEDRELHTYRLRVDGSGKKIPITFRTDPSMTTTLGTKGALMLTVKLLPEGTPSPAALWRAAQPAEPTAKRELEIAQEKKRAEKQAGEESRRREEKMRVEAARRIAELEALRRRIHRESNFLDPEFQEKYARHNVKSIMEK